MGNANNRQNRTLRALAAFGTGLLLLGAQLQAQIKIMPVGDSITWGKVNQNPPPAGTSGYRQILHDALVADAISVQFVGSDPGPADPYRGYYLDGATIGKIDSAKGGGDFNTVLSTYTPNIVILHIGTNNIGSGQIIGNYSTAGSMMNQLFSLVTKITNASSVTHLLLCKVIPKFSTPGTEMETEAYNNAMEIMLSQLTPTQAGKIRLVDMHTPFKANKLLYYNYDLDKVHPSPAGYSEMADIFKQYIKTALQPMIVDKFDRASLGTDWVASPGVQIVTKGDGALECTSTGAEDWGHIAIWKKTKNLNTAKMCFSSNPATMTDKVGILVGMDLAALNANGYMIWVYNKYIRIKTVIAGKAGYGVGSDVASWNIGKNLAPGDSIKVNYRSAADANYFSITINTDAPLTLRDTHKYVGNFIDIYSGLMFDQATVAPPLTATVDKFVIESQIDDIYPPAQISDLGVEFTTNTSVTLGWTAVGNNDYQGTAATYDLRYSSAPITNEADFSRADIVPGMSLPKTAGLPEVYTVTGLQSGSGFYFMIRAIDARGNKGPLSLPVYARTNSAGEVSETFDRPTEPDGTIGPDWILDGNEYRIDYNPTTTEGELTSYQTDGQWGRIAVYKARSNPSIVKLIWGRNATEDAIGQGGFALMLTAPSLAADGYLLWIRKQAGKVLLYNIDNGQPGDGIDEATYSLKDDLGNLRYPQKGDTMAVVMDWNYAGGHKFDVYVNGSPAADRALFDPQMRHNTSVKYAGLILGRNNQANNVTEFITVSESTPPSGLQIVSGNGQSGVVNTTLPDSLKIEVRDMNNTPLPDIPVYFKVLEPVDATVTAPPEPLDPVQIEAEWGIYTGPYYVRNDDPGASGNEYIVSPIRGGEGTATFTFNIQKDTTYNFWLRLISPDNTHYALAFQIDNNPRWINNTLVGRRSSDWQWDRVRTEAGVVAAIRLNRGLHRIILTSAHENVKVDKILLTPRTGFIPTTKEYVAQLMTDQYGVAGTKLKLSTKAGLNRVQVSCFGTAESREFTATGLASVPVLMEKTNDHGSGAARTTLANPFIVTLKDEFGNKVPDITVNFQVTEGDGTLSAAKDTTDANGQASTRLTLGIQSATYKVRATFAGYTGEPVIFDAVATTGLVRRIQGIPVVIPGKHYVDAVLPNFLKALVLDDAGLPVAGVPVTFEVVKGSASPGRIQGKLTDAQGVVLDTLRLGSVAGIVKVLGKVSAVQDTVAKDSVFYKAYRLDSFSGNRQTTAISDTLFNRLKVKVLDRVGQAVANQPVNFLTRGNGFHFPGGLDSIWVMTNSSGIAATNVRTGEVCGAYKDIVEAWCNDGYRGIQGSPVRFTVNAKSTASALVKVSEDSVEGVVREMLPDPIIVKMVDNVANPIAGQPVDFTIKAGGGQFDGTLLPTKRVFTDGDGLASTYFTVGTASGSYNNIIEAAATNGVVALYGSPVIFRISSKSSAADSLSAVSAVTLAGTVGKPLPQEVQVKVTDEHGNPVSGETVKFSIIGGGGALNGTADTTKNVLIDNAGGIASVVWTLGRKAGSLNNVLLASANNGLLPLRSSPVRFEASASPDSVSVLMSTVTATTPVHATESDTSKVTVTLTDLYANPVSGKRVHLEVTGGTRNFPQDPTLPTNSQGKAYGFLRSLDSGVKTIGARVIDDGKTLNSKATVVFLNDKAYQIAVHSGNAQSGNVGTFLRDSLVVKIMDKNLNPSSFSPVQFEVIQGGGIIFSQSTFSDSTGLAWAKLILGPEPGQNVVRVTADALIGSPLMFSATGVEGQAVAMRSVSGSGQRGAAGESLPQPFIVQVVDKAMKAVAGVDIQYAVTIGNGEMVTPQPVKTDAFGYARAFLRTDSRSGQTVWVEARNNSLSNSPQRFNAISVAGPARKLRMLSGNGQYGYVGESLPNPLVVTTTDKFDNPVGGVAVQFAVISGSATLPDQATISVTSDGAGRASATVKLGMERGSVVIEASSPFLEGSPVTFTVSTQTIDAVDIEKFSGDNQKGRIGMVLVDPLRVLVLDTYRNAVPNTQVYFIHDGGGGSIVESQPVTSDSNGIASVRFICPSSPGASSVSALWVNKTVTFNMEAVVDPNNPVLDKALIEPAYEVYEMDDRIIPLVASDADGDPLTFQIANPFPPAGAVIQKQSSNTAVFRWTPGYDQAGVYTIALRVIDGRGGADTDTTVITVKNLNREPQIVGTIPVGGDTTMLTGQKISCLVNARDPDGDPLHYFWKLDGVVVGSDLPFYEFTLDRTNIGSHTMDCYISDGFVSVTRRWAINLEVSVEMEALAAVFSEEKANVRLQWTTVRETNNEGFEILRSTSMDGKYTVLTRELIPSIHGGDYTFEDVSVQVGWTYYYKIVDVDAQGNRHENGPVTVSVPVPKKFALIQNYPNPFNPGTTIRYHVPQKQHVTLSVFDIKGRRVTVLVNREHDPGYFTVQWNGLDMAGREASAGVYIYQLTSPSDHRTLKMLKLK